MNEEKNGSLGQKLLRVAVVIAAVVGFVVAVDLVLEKVFKKYLKVTVELDDIDDDELDDYDECECCCDDEDDDECCCDEECCCECGDEPKAETAEEYEDVESEDTDAE